MVEVKREDRDRSAIGNKPQHLNQKAASSNTVYEKNTRTIRTYTHTHTSPLCVGFLSDFPKNETPLFMCMLILISLSLFFSLPKYHQCFISQHSHSSHSLARDGMSIRINYLDLVRSGGQEVHCGTSLVRFGIVSESHVLERTRTKSNRGFVR